MSHRNYCFTLNNPSSNFLDILRDEVCDKVDGNTGHRLLSNVVTFLVCQLEKGEKGTIHLQGYIELSKTQRITGLKKHFTYLKEAHLEPRMGTQEQAIKYCMKEDTRIEGPWMIGTKSKQGKRTDIEELIKNIDEKPLINIIEENPEEYNKYRNLIKDYKQYKAKKNTQKFRHVNTYTITGKAGIGKTRYVYDTHGYDDVFKLDKPSGSQLWFDGYEGQDVLLIDDFYGWISYGHLLNILDGYPLRLDIKGSFTYANWTKIYITSNKKPQEWYSHGMTEALARRLTEDLSI